MRLPLRGRIAIVTASAGLVLALLLPAASATAADPLILRTGSTQTVSGLNPWQVVYVVDFEIMTLNYDTLVGFGPNVDPVPGFAESWTKSADGHTWTFKIRPGMKWSDGQPATSEDARWTIQYVLDAVKKGQTLGAGYLEPYLTAAGVTAVSAPDPQTLVVTTNLNNPLLSSARVPTRSSSTSLASSSACSGTPTTGASRARRTRSSSRRSRTTTRWSRRSRRESSTTRVTCPRPSSIS